MGGVGASSVGAEDEPGREDDARFCRSGEVATGSGRSMGNEMDGEDHCLSDPLSRQWSNGWSNDTEDEEVCTESEPLHIGEEDTSAGEDCGMENPKESPVTYNNVTSNGEPSSGVSREAELAVAEFDGVDEAYRRYVEYAKATGFAVRKGDNVKDEDGNLVRKFFYCNRQGFREKKHYERVDRKRAHKPETRTNCNAKLVISFEKGSGKWRVKTFVQDHNHDLFPSAFTNVMAAHRSINDGAKAHTHSMHDAGFQTCQIMGSFPFLSGGICNFQLEKRDLYNYIDEVRSSRIVEGDAAAAISYLKGKTELDPLAVVVYTYCSENRLGHLFWSDGTMQFDYECFGDVLAFDLTYRKNCYNRPLVIFSGTNHHRQTTIFGFGLLEDEKISSYKWLLSTFLQVMRQKQPKVVVTDGDEQMKEAIRTEFPNATHRLCAWHLALNAASNIKDGDFCVAFKKAVYGLFDVEEFEQYWAEIVSKFGLKQNEWICGTYEKREHWANAYLCDKFCAGLRTTSRCEGINSFLKKFIKSGSCLLELVENLDRVVKDYRNTELIADYKSLYSEPVMETGLQSIEKAVSKFYTREIFFEVQKQIKGVAALLVPHRESHGGSEKFMLRKFQSHRVYTVLYHHSCESYECSCKLWNSLGIPCSHIFCVLKELDKVELPKQLVLKRWCKDAKSGAFYSSDGVVDQDRAFRYRYGSLSSACISMCLLAAQRPETYENALGRIGDMLKEFKTVLPNGDRGKGGHGHPDSCDILDPKVVRSKEAPPGGSSSKPGRRCRRCFALGHDRSICNAGSDDAWDEGLGSTYRPRRIPWPKPNVKLSLIMSV